LLLALIEFVRGGEAEPPRTLTPPFTSTQKGAGGSVNKNALDTASCILRFLACIAFALTGQKAGGRALLLMGIGSRPGQTFQRELDLFRFWGLLRVADGSIHLVKTDNSP